MIDELKEYVSTHKLEEKTMTREEAIHIIENVNANTNCDNCFYKYDATCEDCRVETALNMSIEALANQKKGE